MFVEGGVYVLVKVYSKYFQVPGKQSLNTNRFYLDICLIYIQFINAGLLTYVHESETFLYVHQNAGTTSMNMKGEYGSIDFWLNEEGIANIFSIPVLKNLGFYITY